MGENLRSSLGLRAINPDRAVRYPRPLSRSREATTVKPEEPDFTGGKLFRAMVSEAVRS